MATAGGQPVTLVVSYEEEIEGNHTDTDEDMEDFRNLPDPSIDPLERLLSLRAGIQTRLLISGSEKPVWKDERTTRSHLKNPDAASIQTARTEALDNIRFWIGELKLPTVLSSDSSVQLPLRDPLR